jgi:hypothetical protein
LAIIATSMNVEQLLEVPKISSGTGYEISSAVFGTLHMWSLLEQVQEFVFDTIASNTGRLNGTCTLLEKSLDREILFLGCQHHIFELVLQGVFIEVKLFTMTGLDILLFKRFQNAWENIDKSKISTLVYDTYIHNILKNEIDEIIVYTKIKIIEDLSRDDYQEFLELVIIFLGSVPPRGIVFRKPGPYHLARWMAKVIYSLKYLYLKINLN